MKLSGTVPFTAPQTAVWQALTDPEQLCSCLPGLQAWQIVADHHFQLQVAWPFAAPGANGSNGLRPVPLTIRWTQLVPPTRLDTTAVFHLANRQQVTVNGRFTLTNPGPTTTELHFQAAINCPNPLLDRLVRSLAPRLIDNYFACLSRVFQ